MPPKAPVKAPAKGPKKGPAGAPGKKAPVNSMIAGIKQRLAEKQAEEDRLLHEAEEKERCFREEERLAEHQRKIEEKETRSAKEAALAEQKEKDHLNALQAKKKNNDDIIQRMVAAGTLDVDIEAVRKRNAELARLEKEKPKKVKQAPKKVVEEPVDDRDDWEIDADDLENKEKQKEEFKKENVTRDRFLDAYVGKLRSPICCVMGHVDAGKTSLLDLIRSTNVQRGEAGGITQQIGATFLPRDNILEATFDLNKARKVVMVVPGLLVIDTPGHESFTNLRTRGSSLCDIAIVVVDVHSGIQKTTKEAVRMLRSHKCPFIVIMNKVDRIYGWKPYPELGFEEELNKQSTDVKVEFMGLFKNLQSQWDAFRYSGELENMPPISLFFDNWDYKNCVSVVPTSAKIGSGVNDFLLLTVDLVQKFMEKKMTLKNQMDCTILELKPIVGLGTTMDVILANGVLYEGDTIVFASFTGPIKTTIRSLLTPQPMKEMRVKSEYIPHKMIRAAMGIKIVADNLADAIPGTSIQVFHSGDSFDEVVKVVQRDIVEIQSRKLNSLGVTVSCSTLGSMEALLAFLQSPDIRVPVSSVHLGKLNKKQLMHAVMMKNKDPKYGVILAFDLNVSDEQIAELEDQYGIKIIASNVIYQLTEMFEKYFKEWEKLEKAELRKHAIFPVILKVDEALHNEDPIILKVTVIRGTLHNDTPLGIIHKGALKFIGKVTSIRAIDTQKDLVVVHKAESCTIRMINSENLVTSYGRHFDDSNELISIVTRLSVDAVKKFSGELDQDSINLLRDLVKLQGVPPPSRREIQA